VPGTSGQALAVTPTRRGIDPHSSGVLLELGIMEATKRCPYCAEEILAAAVRCKHCKSDLHNPSIAQPVPEAPQLRQPGQRAAGCGAILGLLCISIAGMWLFGAFDGPKASTVVAPPATTDATARDDGDQAALFRAEAERVILQAKLKDSESRPPAPSQTTTAPARTPPAATLTQQPAKPPEPNPPARELEAVIEFDGSHLKVTNDDGLFWRNCRIDINAHGLSHGYSQMVQQIGDPVLLDITEFVTSDGERFNPFERKLLTVDIACDTDDGREYFSGQMGPI
jgi:hypothetical protein